jgi:carbon-monoxide dehydrogenase iron sulfur subunit
MALEFIDVHFRKRKALSANPKTCSGCRTCETICSLSHEGMVDLERSRIYIKANPFKGSFVPMVCHQCSDAPCYYACPESAIEIEGYNGTVVIHQEKCTGCHACEKACPFKVIRFDEERKKAFKCDFCHGDPECVKWCPVNALGTTQYGGEIPK